MFDSTKVQSVATLNKINIGALTKENMRLIMRTFMGDYSELERWGACSLF